MKRCLYILMMLGLLLVSCSDDGQMSDGPLTFSVLCPPMQNGRLASRGVFDVPVSEKLAADYPAQITVAANEGAPYVIFKSGDNDNAGFVAYHTSSVEQKDANVAGKSFTAYAPLQWTMIPDVSSEEYLVTKGEGSSRYDSSKAHLFFTMSHVQALLRFNFMVSEKYSRTRQIKVTAVKVNNTGVKLRNEGGFLLTRENNCEAVCYVNPEVISKGGTLSLLCTYDIYDNDGTTAEHLVRKDVTASNVLAIGKSGSSIESILAGKYYDFNITINPDYLYVLSEHDNKHLTIE